MNSNNGVGGEGRVYSQILVALNIVVWHKISGQKNHHEPQQNEQNSLNSKLLAGTCMGASVWAYTSLPLMFKKPKTHIVCLHMLQIDHDPRMPAYIATQGPLSHTIADFWQVSPHEWVWDIKTMGEAFSRWGLDFCSQVDFVCVERVAKGSAHIYVASRETRVFQCWETANAAPKVMQTKQLWPPS